MAAAPPATRTALDSAGSIVTEVQVAESQLASVQAEHLEAFDFAAALDDKLQSAGAGEAVAATQEAPAALHNLHLAAERCLSKLTELKKETHSASESLQWEAGKLRSLAKHAEGEVQRLEGEAAEACAGVTDASAWVAALDDLARASDALCEGLECADAVRKEVTAAGVLPLLKARKELEAQQQRVRQLTSARSSAETKCGEEEAEQSRLAEAVKAAEEKQGDLAAAKQAAEADLSALEQTVGEAVSAHEALVKRLEAVKSAAERTKQQLGETEQELAQQSAASEALDSLHAEAMAAQDKLRTTSAQVREEEAKVQYQRGQLEAKQAKLNSMARQVSQVEGELEQLQTAKAIAAAEERTIKEELESVEKEVDEGMAKEEQAVRTQLEVVEGQLLEWQARRAALQVPVELQATQRRMESLLEEEQSLGETLKECQRLKIAVEEELDSKVSSLQTALQCLLGTEQPLDCAQLLDVAKQVQSNLSAGEKQEQALFAVLKAATGVSTADVTQIDNAVAALRSTGASSHFLQQIGEQVQQPLQAAHAEESELKAAWMQRLAQVRAAAAQSQKQGAGNQHQLPLVAANSGSKGGRLIRFRRGRR